MPSARRVRETRNVAVMTALLLVLPLLLLSAAAAAGPGDQAQRIVGLRGSPQDVVQRTVVTVLAVVRDPALAGERHVVRRRAEIRRCAEELFDFREMARRTLGPHWNDRSRREREEFVEFLESVLERSYMTTIENYAGEPIVYGGQRIDGEYAVVNSKIVTARRAEIPIDYRLYETGAGWAVYDVLIEGISLVSNYRSQFDRIIRTTSFHEVLERLRRADISIMAIRPGASRP